jgi:hypothetical protein
MARLARSLPRQSEPAKALIYGIWHDSSASYRPDELLTFPALRKVATDSLKEYGSEILPMLTLYIDEARKEEKWYVYRQLLKVKKGFQHRSA